jgi:hypothetical protein
MAGRSGSIDDCASKRAAKNGNAKTIEQERFTAFVSTFAIEDLAKGTLNFAVPKDYFNNRRQEICGSGTLSGSAIPVQARSH